MWAQNRCGRSTNGQKLVKMDVGGRRKDCHEFEHHFEPFGLHGRCEKGGRKEGRFLKRV